MPAPTTRNIIGPVYGAGGALLLGYKLVFQRIGDPVSVEGEAVFPVFGPAQPRWEVTTHASTGAFSVAVVVGGFDITLTGPNGAVTIRKYVPEGEGDVPFADLLDTQPTYTPTLVQQAGVYAASAEAARDEAEAARDAAAGSASDAEAARDAAAGSASDADGSATDAAASEVAAEGHATASAVDAGVAAAASAAAVEAVEVYPTLTLALDKAFTDPLLETVTTATTARLHSEVPAKTRAIVRIEGNSLTTAVTPLAVAAVGKNLADHDPRKWEVGTINGSGVPAVSGSQLRTVDFIPVVPGETYCRRGLTVGANVRRPVVTIYTDAGVFSRQILTSVGVPDNFTLAEDETKIKLAITATGANPAMVVESGVQIERGATPTPYEPYSATVATFAPTDLYAHEDVKDRIEGLHHVQNIVRRTITYPGTTTEWTIQTGAATAVGDFYRALLTINNGGGAAITAEQRRLLIGKCADGDFPLNPGNATEARGVFYGSATDMRITVEKAKIDAMAGATTVAKFQAYLAAYPVECIFDRGSYATTTPVATGYLIVPQGGSVVVTGAAAYSVRWLELSSGGGAGGDVTARVTGLENTTALQTISIAALEAQLAILTVSGSTDPETAAARVSSLTGLTYASLAGRINDLERVLGRIDVRSFGAIGDGVENDTAAILLARDVAEANNLDLFFSPCADAYMLDRGLRLLKSTKVIGHPKGKIRKIAAFTTAAVGTLVQDQTVIPVTDASGFVIGQDVYIGPDNSSTSYPGTRGVVTAISLAGGANSITVQSYNCATSTGLRVGWADGVAKVSSTFPMIYTDATAGASPKISPQILGVHFDGNKQPTEPNAYTIASVHLDPVLTVAAVVDNCVFEDSPSDAISDQTDGWTRITNNRIYRPRWHGIHTGFTNVGVNCHFNYVEDAGRSAYYFCYLNSKCRISHNLALRCPCAYRELGSDDGTVVIASPINVDCAIEFELIGAGDGVVNISDIVSEGCTDHILVADGSSRFTITGRAAFGTGVGVELTRCEKAKIALDFSDWLGSHLVRIAYAAPSGGGLGRSRVITIEGQLIGGTTACVEINSCDDISIRPSITQPEDGVPSVLFSTTAGQAAPDRIRLDIGLDLATVPVSGTVTDLRVTDQTVTA